MSIQVQDFYYIPGENDAEYIRLLQDALDRQKQLTSRALAKVKALSLELREYQSQFGMHKEAVI